MKLCRYCNEPFTGAPQKKVCDACRKKNATSLQRDYRKRKRDGILDAAMPLQQPAPRLKPIAAAYDDYDRWTAKNHYRLRMYDWQRRKWVVCQAIDVGRCEDVGAANRIELTEAGMI